MMKQVDRLIEAIGRTGNPTALGLDTRLSYLPVSYREKFFSGSPDGEETNEKAIEAVFSFNRALIDTLCPIVPCVKIQVAYYEMLGVPGMRLFRDTLLYARQKGMVTIADVKRNDIGATAEAYAATYLSSEAPFPADFVTLNAYLGSDGITPFLEGCKKTGGGVFILVRTSNPSARELQDLLVEGRPLYERLGEKVALWGESLMGEHGYSSVGAVVGATWPEEGARLRKILPHTFFLVPGYGAQGATARDLRGCFDSRGNGAIVNASRSLLCAHQKKESDDFTTAAYEEALRMRDDIRSALMGKE